MDKYNDREEFSNAHSYRDSRRKRLNAVRNKLIARAEKVRRGCEVTGRRYPHQLLQFHHVEKKGFNIGSGYHRSEQSFRRELKKCIVVHIRIHDAIHHGEISEERVQRAFRRSRKQ